MSTVDESVGLHWPKPEIVTIAQTRGEGKLKIYDGNNVEITPETNICSSLKQNQFQTLRLVGEEPGEVELTVRYGNDKIVIAEDKVMVTVVELDLRTDLDRDGTVEFDSDDDKTTEDAPWRFWINNDYDNIDADLKEEADLAPNGVSDSADKKISVKRDLEDFSILQLRPNGFSKKDIKSGKVECHLRFNPRLGGSIGSFDFNLFYFPKGSPAYLTDEGIAEKLVKDSEKLNIPNSDYYGEFIIDPKMFNDDMEAVFLFEGKKSGKRRVDGKGIL